MNVIATNQSAVTNVTEAIKIKYSMTTRGTDSVKEITAEIIKNETVIGFFNTSKNGVTGFSLQADHGLTKDEVKNVFQNAIEDCSTVL